MGLFFIECSDFHIKNSLKTFGNIFYALIYGQQVVIICSQYALEHTSTGPSRHYVEATEPRKFKGREVVQRFYGFLLEISVRAINVRN